jgi:hypothetical protein
MLLLLCDLLCAASTLPSRHYTCQSLLCQKENRGYNSLTATSWVLWLTQTETATTPGKPLELILMLLRAGSEDELAMDLI